ncbi:MAG: hypothetical protein J6K04_12745 [Lachnospiraceae bacterium]|nr:hypothetical protein [Lachnospiraceae bacterium]
MSYINAKEVLPEKLLDEIRKYVEEGLLYIPPAQAKRRQWGSKSGAKQMLEARNEEIRRKKGSGVSISCLAKEYNLSAETIKRILYR